MVRILYYLIPAASLAFFAVSLILYLFAKYKNGRAPGTYSDRQMTVRRLCLIVSAVIFAVMAAAVIAVMALVAMVLAYM